MSGKAKHLFYHYGPGGNCDVERAWLAAKYPSIIFWDQPSCHSFSDLKKACSAELHKVFKSGEKINIIAHSFGCDLALAVLAEEKIKVDTLILISPISNLYESFKNFARLITEQDDISSELKSQIQSEIKKINQNLTLENFWILVGLMVQYANFGSLYWRSEERLIKYQKALLQTKPFDFSIWRNVLDDYLQKYSVQTEIIYSNLKIIIGLHDPYMNQAHEAKFWQSKFSDATIEFVESGHYPHLELESLSLMSRGTQPAV